ncbi:tetratricopeptide repeat protein [Blastococcus sp. MG754426]|uniref:ATP-binding protein n=1 Tax=unclassified Blastococcus TaxID=2619396 RepID=UPI001EF14147|nr:MULTISPECIES: AAA family ATPase [unclassified Blastococcus]MCF6508238.1 tetratricopeptide repeat protein [Blastococcus sp. MG754426]MCF6512135.1 tetratricopeptide repeat protein [Blastococcus sp. MG754427]
MRQLPDESRELRSLEDAISALEGQRAVLGDVVVDTALAPLVDKRDRLVAAAVGQQRRQVVVLFADLVDSTPVATRLDPEDLQQVMSRWFTAARAAVEDEGGVVEKFIGDAVMAVFGLYRSREDDAVRAVRAALAVQAAVQRLDAEIGASHGLRLRVRVGVDTGEVVVTGMGDRAAGEFLAVGDTTSRAARLQAAAAPGTVLVSRDTADQVRGAFGLRRLTGLRLKGIDSPVDAYVVAGADREEFWPEARGVEGVRTRTVGREEELAHLQDAFGEVVTGRGRRIVTVLGEAGVGKSRLVREVEGWLARLPSEVWVLRGRAAPATQGVANALLRSVFAERFGIRGTDDPGTVRRRWAEGWSRLLGDVPAVGGGGDPESDERAAWTVAAWLGFGLDEPGRAAVGTTDPEVLRRRGSVLVLRMLEDLALRAPVVVLLEDLHWADAASLASLQALADAPGEGPLLVVCTARPTLFDRHPDWGRPGSSHAVLQLAPLGEDDAAALVGELLQRAERVPDRLVRMVVDTSDGNPFYVEELVTWLVQAGVVDTRTDPWRVRDEAVGSLRVPSTLRGLLQARLDALDGADRAVVGCAAVVGRVFWDAAVERLSRSVPGAAGEGSLDRLTRREVVLPRPRSTFSGSHEYSFRHALVRDVAYEGVLRSVRRRLHGQAAQWLEEVVEESGRPDEHAAEVARHHEEAGERAAAARWFLRAGRYAAAGYANEDALRLLARAEALVPPEEGALWSDVLLARQTVLDRLGRREEQRSTLDRLAAAPGPDPARRAEVRLAEGGWLFFRGEYPAIPPVADAAAELARQAGRRDLESDALMQGGRSLAYLNEHDRARELLTRALELARAVGDHRRAGETLRLLGVVATNQGRNEEALQVLQQAREEHRAIHDEQGEAMVSGQLGALLVNCGRLDEARVASEQALAVFRASGHRYREGVMLTNLARIAMDEGRLDDALEDGRRALALTEEIDDAEGVVASLQSLGDSHRLAGDLPAARRYLERGLAESDRHELAYFRVHLLASLAVVDLREGDLTAARARAAEAQEEAAGSDVPHAGVRADLVAGMVRHAAGDRMAVEPLRAAARRAAELDVQADRVEALGLLAGALLEAGDLPAALALVDELLPALEGAYPPGGVEHGRAFVDAHRVLVAAGDPRAGVVARWAADHLAGWAARIGDERLRAGFLATPVARELCRIGGG